MKHISALSLLMLAGISHVLADNTFPVLRVPELPTAPEMDGRVSLDEWAGAAAFTGLSGNPIGNPFLLPGAQQATWYFGFKGDTLYIAMRSPHPKGTIPTGQTKQMDDGDVLWGDHVEIRILTHDRVDAGRPGKGFYQMLVNARGAMQDSHMYNGTPGTEDFWTTGGEVKCHVTDEMWQMELSVKAANLKLPKFDGQSVVMQVVRADAPSGGIYYAGWVGYPFMDWKRFGQVTFDAATPAFQLNRLGEVMAGDLDVAVAVTGGGDQSQAVDVEMTVEDASGKVLFQDKQSASVGKGQRKELAFRKAGLAVSDVELEGGRNHVGIKATWRDGRTETVLYQHRMPFMKLTPAWRAKYLDPWLANRPQSGDWDAVFAYLPYSGQATAKADVDFFGLPEAIRQATRFEVEVRKKGGDSILAQSNGVIKDGAAETLFAVPELAEGDYDALFRLYRDGRNKPVAEKTIPFVRKRYPFERNRLGLSDEVIPPFVPMRVNTNVIVGPAGRVAVNLKGERPMFTVWGRTCQIGSYGLFDQVVVIPPSGTAGRPEPLLAASMRFECVAQGKTGEVSDTSAHIVMAAPHRVDVEGHARLGDLGLSLKGKAEYDGWYEVELTVSGQLSEPSTISSFDLVIDMRDQAGDRKTPAFPADTLYVQRMGAGLDFSYHGGIPRKPGVHYVSTSLGDTRARTGPADVAKDWMSFAPVTYIGNGDRGLWFFAWSDAGWVMKKDDPVVRVERLAGGTARLRVRLMSGPVSIDKPRTLRFALQAAPIKPNDVKYRSRIEEVAHDSSGYRYYGDSVDSYVLNTDQDYAELRKFLLYGTTLQENPDPRYAGWDGRIGRQLRTGAATRLMLYGSQWMTGLGAEEFDSFGGEWMGRNNWKPIPDTKFSGKKNYGGTVTWTTPRQISAARVNWPQSMLDFFVWYHERLIDKCGINGTWWDNCYAGTVTEYDPELGRLDAKWNFYNRRQLCKRLNVIGWEHLRPPCWSMNTEIEMSWCQMYWLVEGFWGPSAKDISTIDHFGSIDFFRAATRPKSTVMTCSTAYMTHFRGSTPEKDREMTRSSDGILLSHDIPPVNDKELRRKLNYVVDYDRTDNCLFMGYWMTPPFVQLPGQGLRASVYMNPDLKRAVLVFFNTDKNDQALGGTTFNAKGVVMTSSGVPAEAEGPLNLKKVYDLETGEAVKTSFRDGRMVIDEPFVVGGHEFRLLALEAE